MPHSNNEIYSLNNEIDSKLITNDITDETIRSNTIIFKDTCKDNITNSKSLEDLFEKQEKVINSFLNYYLLIKDSILAIQAKFFFIHEVSKSWMSPIQYNANTLIPLKKSKVYLEKNWKLLKDNPNMHDLLSINKTSISTEIDLQTHQRINRTTETNESIASPLQHMATSFKNEIVSATN